VKGVINKLRDINWLYSDVDQTSVDEAGNVVSVADSTMKIIKSMHVNIAVFCTCWFCFSALTQ